MMAARPEGGAVAEPGITIDADAIDEAAHVLDSLHRSLHDELAQLRDQAVAAYGAIPPSDLHDAFGYCWGRWSQVMHNSLEELAGAVTAARQVANEWRSTEIALARQADDAASNG
jgi:hypothetical protein